MRRRKLVRFIIVVTLLVLAFFVYVEYVNRNSKNMTGRQKILKAVYPALMWFNKVTGKRSKTINMDTTVNAPISFYTLGVTLNNGDTLKFDSLKGKKILLVNTASQCGYTNQYDDLQKLSKEYGDKLVVIGFPANDFKEQEKGSDAEIAEFCRLNFGVTFPLVKKSSVIKGPDQNAVYQWLTDKAKNGWNEQQPNWNFSKYLISENGDLLKYFDAGVAPMSTEVLNAVSGVNGE